MTDQTLTWFSVRTVVRCLADSASTYEERVTLWQAASFEQAIALAEQEARDYAEGLPAGTYVGLAQAYWLFDQPRHGAEIFSLLRDSDLAPDEYVDAYFDTGTERQGDITG